MTATQVPSKERIENCRKFFADKLDMEQKQMRMTDIIFYLLQRGLVKDFNQAISTVMFAIDNKVLVANILDEKETFERKHYYLKDSTPF